MLCFSVLSLGQRRKKGVCCEVGVVVAALEDPLLPDCPLFLSQPHLLQHTLSAVGPGQVGPSGPSPCLLTPGSHGSV